MATTLNRKVAGEAREYARKHGIVVGERGRLSREALAAFFAAQPRRAREVAATLSIPTPKRGRLGENTALTLADAVR